MHKNIAEKKAIMPGIGLEWFVWRQLCESEFISLCADYHLSILVHRVTVPKKPTHIKDRARIHQIIDECREGINQVKNRVIYLKDFSYLDAFEWPWMDLLKGKSEIIVLFYFRTQV